MMRVSIFVVGSISLTLSSSSGITGFDLAAMSRRLILPRSESIVAAKKKITPDHVRVGLLPAAVTKDAGQVVAIRPAEYA